MLPKPDFMGKADQNRLRAWATAGAAGGLLWFLISRERAKQQPQSQSQGEATYLPLVQEAAAATNVPASVLAGIVTAESSWNNSPNKYSAKCGVNCIASSACAVGIAQLLPSTARDMGVTGDLCEPRNNLLAAARYLRRLYTKYGDWEKAAQAYNWGPGNIDKSIKAGTPVYSGTVAYANKVVSQAAVYRQRGLSGTDATPRVSLFRLRHA